MVLSHSYGEVIKHYANWVQPSSKLIIDPPGSYCHSNTATPVSDKVRILWISDWIPTDLIPSLSFTVLPKHNPDGDLKIEGNLLD